MECSPPKSTLFPYTTLFRSIGDLSATDIKHLDVGSWKSRKFAGLSIPTLAEFLLDRKSTRLNSSHVAISYAVFCLKKKIITIIFASMQPENRNIHCCRTRNE